MPLFYTWGLFDGYIKTIHNNRLKQFYRLGKNYDASDLKRFPEEKRLTILTVFLFQLLQELIDKAFEIHDRQMLSLFNKGQRTQKEINNKNGKSINEKINYFILVSQEIIKAKETGEDVFQAIESIIEWHEFVNSVEESKKLVQPIDYDYLGLIKNKFYVLRKYTPVLIDILTFCSYKENDSLIKAIQIIKEMNIEGKRKIKVDVPIDFISNRWKKYLYSNDGLMDKYYYEMAVMNEIRERVRSGDLSIEGSKQYKNFDSYLIPKQNWVELKKTSTTITNINYCEYINERKRLLSSRLEWLDKNITLIPDITIKGSEMSLKRLEKNTPEEAKKLSEGLYKLIPKINLADLLMDVAKLTKFHEEFIHISTGKKPNLEETKILMAALLGMGTNIGLSKMSDATPEISYKQLSDTSTWRIYDAAINKAQAILVNFQNKLSLSNIWGDGDTSSSDGMRMLIGCPFFITSCT